MATKHQRMMFDVEMLQAIARRLNEPFEMVFAAYVEEMRYRIRQAEAKAETAYNQLAALQAMVDEMERRRDREETP